MKGALVVLMLAVAVPAWWRESNSHREAARGAKAFSSQQYDEAMKAYASADAIAPAPGNAFNAGTAAIAAGKRSEGAALMGRAMADAALRADALYNRGNGALAANALDVAVRDYIGALRADPRHAAAKRNLEIALQRKRQEEQQRSSSGEQGGDKGNQQPKPAPGQRPAKGELDVEALLRSVQQAEQEELRRLKGETAEGKVGW